MKKIYFLFAALFAVIIFFTGCKKEEYVVTFNPNGGKGALITQNFTEKVAQPLMANSFTKSGYVFTGWKTTPDGNGTAYKDQETIIVSGHLVLYAQWGTPNGSVTVTFKANGGKGNMDPQTFEAGIPKALSANMFYYDNYMFIGWCTSPDGKGKHFSNEQNISFTADITLYAQWEIYSNTYFVFFDANGGTGKMESQKFFDNEYKSLDSNKFVREGFIFKEWNTKADGTGVKYVNCEKTEIYSNLVLYAQWINPSGGGKPCPGTPTVTDVDGNSYNTVQIGSQCWMRENLKTTKYKTNKNILKIENVNLWFNNTTGAMCYYNNLTENGNKYGALYNGYAVKTGELCPTGWHIPSNDEWNTLAGQLGGADMAGYKMKTVYDWMSDWYQDGNGSNESGFSALPAGMRDYYSYNFYGLNQGTSFWTSTEDYYNEPFIKYLFYDSNSLGSYSDYLSNGFSVRCIKD